MPGYQPQIFLDIPVMAGEATGLNIPPLEPYSVFLPNLGNCVMVNNDGIIVSENTIFRGGIAVNGGAYQSTVTMQHTDNVKITGEITPDIAHLAQKADILVVAGYKPLVPGSPERFFMRTAEGGFLHWNHRTIGGELSSKGEEIYADRIL
ncbi:MAG: hypothetical protein GY869_16575, partial [Planctomycetes bacterium]|nr:hypothetical protein [Planctomycetota bacterium]